MFHLKMFITTLVLFVISFDHIESLPIEEAVSKFTRDVYRVLSHRHGNIAFSPLSLHSALTLAYEGASGSTSKVLEDVLNLDDQETTASNYKSMLDRLKLTDRHGFRPIRIANGLFVNSFLKIQDSLKDIAVNSFDSKIYSVRFGNSNNAVRKINLWVEQKTAGKITHLLTPQQINSATELVIVNALYFADKWAVKFNFTNTKVENFYKSSNRAVPVKMMHNTIVCLYREIEELDAKMIKLSYNFAKAALVLILPNKKNGIKALESKLNPAKINSHLETSSIAEVYVSLPKFKIESKLSLKSVLEELGLGEIFSDSADFSRLLKNNIAKVSGVIQKTYIDVNEEGTEAAAATAVVLVRRHGGGKPNFEKRKFIANHPFVFALVGTASDQAANILFYGRVLEPNNVN